MLPLFFFITAVLYASVGFGGGSTYNALLVLAETDYRVLPSIALICNILVVTVGSIHSRHAGYLNFKHTLPYVVLSVPMAWLGGRLSIDQQTFAMLLGSALLVAGLLMIRAPQRRSNPLKPKTVGALALVIGAAIGLLSGLVGIGGGIFLSPYLHLLSAESPKRIAATSSVFIFANSVAGLLGQSMKSGNEVMIARLTEFAPLFVAVLVGGLIGTLIGMRLFSQRVMRRATAILVLYVACRLLLFTS